MEDTATVALTFPGAAAEILLTWAADERRSWAQVTGDEGALELQDDTLVLTRDAVKHLEGKLWELRIMGRDGISRAIYVAATGRRVVVVRVFIKKTQRTPNADIALALQRMKEIA